MKRMYIIKAQCLADQNKYGFIKVGESIKIFTSRWSARRYLRKNTKDLRIGWGHYITKVYLKTPSRSIQIKEQIQLGGVK
jgi:hypothetical protein